MSESPDGRKSEIERIRRVSDMLCSAHAGLRDKFARRALYLDLIILGFSTWLVALVFVRPRINATLTPWDMDPQIWIGILGVLTFFLTVVHMKVDWKGLSDAHARAMSLFVEIKRESGILLRGYTEVGTQRLLDRYELVNKIAAEIPEKDFLREKRRHQMKIAVSRHLDAHPGASISIFKLRLWLRDNLRARGDRSC